MSTYGSALYVVAFVLFLVAAYLSAGARDRLALVAAALTVLALGWR